MSDDIIKQVKVEGSTLTIDVGQGIKVLTVAHDTKRLVCQIIRPHLSKAEQTALDLIDLTDYGLAPTEVVSRPITEAKVNSGIMPKLPFKATYAGCKVKVLTLSWDRQTAGISTVLAGRKPQKFVPTKDLTDWVPM